jgi:hypothetical protein
MNKGALWNSILEAPNVGVEHPVHALPLDAHRQRVQRLVRAASGTEPIRESLEVHLMRAVPDTLHDAPGCADRLADLPTRFHTPATSRHLLPVLLAALRHRSYPGVGSRSHGEAKP